MCKNREGHGVVALGGDEFDRSDNQLRVVEPGFRTAIPDIQNSILNDCLPADAEPEDQPAHCKTLQGRWRHRPEERLDQ